MQYYACLGGIHDYLSPKEGTIMRGYRLQQANRIARRMLDTFTFCYIKCLEPQEREKVFGIMRKTQKRCSCWMCCNRRRYEGPKIQELRQIDNTDFDY